MAEQRVRRNRIVVDDSALATRIGERIRHARHEAGMTQQQLAQGRYTKAYISALEKGHAKPSMAALNFISERLGLPPSRFLVDSASAWNRISADLLLASGSWQLAVEAYSDLLAHTVDRGARAELLRGLAEAHCRLEQGEAAIAPAAEAVGLFEALGRAGDASLARYWLANANFLVDNRVEARALLSELLRDLRRNAGGAADADPDLLMRVLIALGLVETQEEDHRVALAYLEEARVLARDLDNWRGAALLSAVAANHAGLDDLEGAIRAGTESLALYRAAHAERESAILENNLAVAYLRVGDLERAAQLAAFARARQETDGDRRMLAHIAETEAQIALAQGRHADARLLAAEAIEHAEASHNSRALTSALLTTARAEAADRNVEAAAEAYARALAVLREVGPVAKLQQALGEWAEILADMGRHEEAYALTREALRAGNQAGLDGVGPPPSLGADPAGDPESGPTAGRPRRAPAAAPRSPRATPSRARSTRSH